MLPNIVVLGSLNIDFFVRVPELPAAGETILGSDFQTAPGGKGANQAFAAGRLGHGTKTSMIGRVGDDVFGEQLRRSLASAGVDVSAVLPHTKQPTGVALIWIDRKGQNSIVVASGANLAIAPAEVDAETELLKNASLALFQLETPLNAVAAGLRIARSARVRTILDPAPAQPLLREILDCVDILTPNETEALTLLGRQDRQIAEADAPDIARALRASGSRSVILKMGSKGCFYSDGATEQFVRGFAVNTVDTTAAGDVFNGALSVALAEGLVIAEALRFANAAAAISTTKVGAQSSVPSRSEVDAFLKSCAS